MKLFLIYIIHAVPFVSAFTPSGASYSNVGRRTVPNQNAVAAGWYAGWTAGSTPPSAIPYDKYTHLTYSFAETTPNVDTLSLSDSDNSLLPDFVKGCHNKNVKALCSIGGWTGSRFFSTNVGSATNRTKFVKTVTDLATRFNLDGIDFDWESPNNKGIGCNSFNKDDAAHLLSFLQELRANPIGKNLILTAAVSLTPFTGPDGKPLGSAADFAKFLDYVAIMNYDVWGSWSPTVGPNAPLDDSCASGEDQQGSATSAVKAWTSAGFPTNKIVLGVPAYGHSFFVAKKDAYTNGNGALAAYPKFDAKKQPQSDSSDVASTDVCGIQEGISGVFNFRGLVQAGFLTQAGKPAPGISYRFDKCSKTPYLYNNSSQVMVSYDDPTSFSAKGNFIAGHRLRGFAMWDVNGDYDNLLLSSIRQGAGFP